MITLKTFRFAMPVALVAACSAPDVGRSSTQPAPAVTAVFDPLTGSIPLPNDLALAQIPPTLPPAQQDLLRAFQAQGGFPNDQEVPVTISFQRSSVAADGSVTSTPPDLDVASLNAGTLLVFLKTAQGAGPVALDPIQPSDYVKGTDRGTLTLHNKGRQPWTPGQYVLAIRGGPNGAKTTAGEPVVASPTFFLIAQGENLDTEENLALLRAQTGSTEAAKAAAAQLQPIIDQYKAGGAFAAVDQVFPHQEAAIMTTFTIAPIAGTQVQLDAGRGLVPLPIDLLRDPRPASATCAACGHLTPLAACTFAQGTLDAQGVCRDAKGNVNGAAAGFAALDGFSTTGFILSPTSDLVATSTITPTTVKLFDLTNPAQPALVDPATYITEPVELTQSGLSSVIALQPAGATAGDQSSVFRTRPLKDNTDYAVVITDGVHDKTGKALVPGTAAKILQFTNPVADANGKSQLAGIDDATAFGLEAMRQKLVPVLNSAQVNKGHVAMAFTFHTQTIRLTAAQLAGLPYATGNTTLGAVPGSTKIYCSAAVAASPACASSAGDIASIFSAYGVDTAKVPDANVAFVIETVVPTFNKLLCNAGDATCHDTGAFNPANVNPVVEPINVLIALPAPPFAGGCVPSTTPCTIPLVIFRHGLGGGRADMLTVADRFNAAGFGVAAIDAAKHGDRSLCKANSECAGGGTCVADPALANEADAPGPTPGHCSAGFVRRPTCTTCTNTKAIPIASSNFLVSANFFRTRDTLRQDIIDESQLVRVLSPDPTGAQLGNLITTPLVGVQFDPTRLSFAGQSLGAIQGTVDVAANPRLQRAVLNVGGATVVDIFVNSPAFSTATAQLLGSLGIQEGANSAFLQFLVVAKTILDPADPVNFAQALTDPARALPNILADPTGATPQGAKQGVLTQAAFCDQVVPNPFNFILDSNVRPFPFPPTGAPGNFQLFFRGTPSATTFGSCPSPTSGQPPPAANAVNHAFFTDWAIPAITTQAQDDAATFLGTLALPPSLRVFP